MLKQTISIEQPSNLQADQTLRERQHKRSTIPWTCNRKFEWGRQKKYLELSKKIWEAASL